MRIIKQGRHPSVGDTHESTCRTCGTVFEWNTNEAIRQPDQREGDYFKIACPLCGASATKAVSEKAP
ncbi:hypothetical protein ACCP99_08260 [Xanthomonas sp. NCPPB 3443]|uniref:hypothetical protein n=1 Tax=Xanthomonas sp. NCPPB 3443 TaxID=3243407 RepID=UPI0035574F4E